MEYKCFEVNGMHYIMRRNMDHWLEYRCWILRCISLILP